MRIQQWGIVLLLSGSAACFGQVAANGNCNVAAGNVSGGNITIQCGLTPEDAKALARADKNVAAQNRILNEILARLKQQPKTDFSLGVVQAFLATIKGKQIPVEKWPETFGELSRDYLKLGAELKAIPVTSDAVKQLVERADEARKKGDLTLTDSLLQKAIELSSADARKKRDDAKASAHQTAQLLESRASVAFTRLERFQGARLLEEAFEWRKDDPDSKAIWWLFKAGDKVREGGKTDEALRLYTKAQRAAQRSAEDNPNDTKRQRDLSVSYYWIGEIQQAQGKLAAALQSFQSLMAIAKKLTATDPSNTLWQRDLSVSYDRIGEIQQVQGQLAEALENFQSVITIRKKLTTIDPSNTEWQRDLSVSYNKIGNIQQAQGELAAALQSFQEGMVIVKKLIAADTSNTEWQRDLSVSYEKIGEIQQAQGELVAALQSFQSLMAITKKLTAADPSNTEWQRDLSVSYGKIGEIQQAQGELVAALQSFQSYMAIAKKLTTADPSNTLWQRDLVVSYAKIASLGEAAGTVAYRRSLLQEGLSILKKLAANNQLPEPETNKRWISIFENAIADLK